MGSWTSSDLLVMGAFAPTVASSTWLTLQLAADELREGEGLPTRDGQHRPLLLVACDDGSGRIEEAAAHLAALRAHAVVAPAEQSAVEALLPLMASRNPGVVLAANGFELRPGQAGADLFWALGAPSSRLADSYPTFIRLVAATVAAQSNTGGAVRIATLASAAPEDQALAAAVAAGINLEGRDLVRLMIEGRFQAFTLLDDSPSNRAQTLQQLAIYAPHVIVVVVSGYFADADRLPGSTAITAIEELAAANAEWSPFYIFGPGNANDPLVRLLMIDGSTVRLRSLLMSAQPMPIPELIGAAQARFAAAYPQAQPGVGLEPGTYDAAYYLAYALAAAPREGGTPRVKEVLAGLQTVTASGLEPVDVGPGPRGLERAKALLANGMPFDLVSTSGPAAFDASHLRAAVIGGYCWNAEGILELAATYDGVAATVVANEGTTPEAPAGCAREVFGDADP